MILPGKSGSGHSTYNLGIRVVSSRTVLLLLKIKEACNMSVEHNATNYLALINSKWYHVNQIDTAQRIVKVQDVNNQEMMFNLDEVSEFFLEPISS